GELSVCCKAAHRAGARRSRGPDVPERLGARPGREEHQLVQADCRRAWSLLQGRPSSWWSPFPGSRRTRETRCSPWGGGAPARPRGSRRAQCLLQGRPIELVLDVPGGQTYPRDSVLALGGMSTSSSTHTLSGAQHLRRGQVVAAATAPFLAFGDLQPGAAE